METHLKKLMIHTEIPSIPLPSVETLTVYNKDFGHQHFQLFPNVKELRYHTYLSSYYDKLPNYNTDDIPPKSLDFSSLRQLKILGLNMKLVAADEFGNYNVIFPPQLTEVALEEFNDTTSLHSLQNLTCLETLSLCFSLHESNNQNEFNFRLQVPFPPNVNDLHIYNSPFEVSKPIDIRTIPFPSQMTRLKLEGDIVIPSDYKFPNTLKVLNIGPHFFPRWHVPTLDLSHLTNLTHLSTGGFTNNILPPNLKYSQTKCSLNPKESPHYPIDIKSVADIVGIEKASKFEVENHRPIEAFTGTTEDGHYVEIVDCLSKARFPHIHLGSYPQWSWIPKNQTLKTLHLHQARGSRFLNFPCFYCLPDTLEALYIDGGIIEKPFPCSKNLKYLKVDETHWKHGLIFNEKLQVLSIIKSRCNLSKVLEKPAPCLQTIHAVSSDLGPLDFNLLGTDLQHFSIEGCHYELISMQLPEPLIKFEITKKRTKTSIGTYH